MRRERETQEKEAILMVDDDDEEGYPSDCGNEDDNRSISSESSSCGEFKKESLMLRKNCEQESADLEIWRLFQVDAQNMKDIPNAEAVLSTLTACDLNGKLSLVIKLNNQLSILIKFNVFEMSVFQNVDNSR